MIHISQCDGIGTTRVISQITRGSRPHRSKSEHVYAIHVHQEEVWIPTATSSVTFVVPTVHFSSALHEKIGREKIPWHGKRRDGAGTKPLRARRNGTGRDGNFPPRTVLSRLVPFRPISSHAVPSGPHGGRANDPGDSHPGSPYRHGKNKDRPVKVLSRSVPSSRRVFAKHPGTTALRPKFCATTTFPHQKTKHCSFQLQRFCRAHCLKPGTV